MKTFIVIPTIRNLDFLFAWSGAFSDCHVIVVEDGPTKTACLPRAPRKQTLQYCWEDIRKDFGKKEWIFSRRSAGIRSYGFWKAYMLGADIIITLDDDCYPVDFTMVQQHRINISRKAPAGWTTTYPHPDFVYTRGIPYGVRGSRRVVVSHGLWTNKIDLDGKTEVQHPNLHLSAHPPTLQFIPPHVYFPMCSMNLAFHRDVVPLMYFPLMGVNPEGVRWGYDRFDDIWAGIFAKKILDHLGWSVVSGSPFVEHRKASDPYNNLAREKEGLIVNEWLWKRVDEVSLTQKTPATCYRELATRVRFPKSRYFNTLKEAMILWSHLFS